MNVQRFARQPASRLVLAAGFAGGCAGEAERPGVVVRDSAGINIVENQAPEWQPGAEWRLSPEPILEIGVTEGAPEYELLRVSDVLRMPDGRIVVANGGTQEIRLYDEGGRFLRVLGGPGEGPGEFRNIAAVEHVGADTLMAADFQLRRLITIGPTGEPLWERPIDSQGLLPAGVPAWLPDGTFFLGWATELASNHVADGRARIGETVRNRIALVRHSAAGSVLDTLGMFHGREEAIFSPDGTRPMFTGAPFGRKLTYAAGQDRIYLGTQDNYEIAEYAANGALVRMVRWVGPDLEITDRAAEEFVGRTTAAIGDPGERSRWETLLRSLPRPPQRAAYGDALIDGEGNLWVSEYSFGRFWPVRWEVFDPSGRWLGVVAVPQQTRVFEIGEDYLLGVFEDELGVEQIRLYRLEKPA